jgi:ankyrin repeat protein
MQEPTPTPSSVVPILTASRAGHLSEVVESLRNRDDVNARDKQGRTPLMLAAIGAHSTLVELLLNADADPNIKNKKGWTALRYAIDSHNLDLIRLLIRKGADPDETDADGFTLTRHFLSEKDVLPEVRAKRIEIADLLTECGGQGKDQDEFIKAVEAGFLDRARSLLERGVDANTKKTSGETALMLAAKRGLLDTAKSLLESGADIHAVDKNGWTALMHTSSFFHYLSPLANAEDQANIVHLLVAKGADIDATDKGGNTALMQAAPGVLRYDVQIVRVLLDHHADVHVKNVDGRNALALAVLLEGGHLEIVEALLSRGADPNSAMPISDLSDGTSEDPGSDLAGMSVLIWTAMFGREDIIKLLLSARAIVNKRLNNGLTALHFAALRGDTQIVKQLVSEGADLARYGLEALALASKSGAIAQYLIGCGVDHNLVDPKLIKGLGRGTIDTAALTMRTEGVLSRARAIDLYATKGVRAQPLSGGLPGQGKRR